MTVMYGYICNTPVSLNMESRHLGEPLTAASVQA